MNTLGWACTSLGVAVLVVAVWYLGYLSGRRRESGIWQAWMDQMEQEQHQVRERRKPARGIQLSQVSFRRKGAGGN